MAERTKIDRGYLSKLENMQQANTTLETVSRTLSQLNDDGVLVFSSARQIVLRNRARLAEMDA